MNRFDALDEIKSAWEDAALPLGEKALTISEVFYDVGLDIQSAAAYAGATPAELSILLSLGGRSDEVLQALSKTNPPLTACAVLADASDEDILAALQALREQREPAADVTASELVYQAIIELVGPSPEMKVSTLPSSVLLHALGKGKAYGKLDDWSEKFLRNIAARKRSGNSLTDRQASKLVEVLGKLRDGNAISRNSIDGDQAICDKILDALED